MSVPDRPIVPPQCRSCIFWVNQSNTPLTLRGPESIGVNGYCNHEPTQVRKRADEWCGQHHEFAAWFDKDGRDAVKGAAERAAERLRMAAEVQAAADREAAAARLAEQRAQAAARAAYQAAADPVAALLAQAKQEVQVLEGSGSAAGEGPPVPGKSRVGAR